MQSEYVCISEKKKKKIAIEPKLDYEVRQSISGGHFSRADDKSPPAEIRPEATGLCRRNY